jgi:pimeloyl-ACP methyl ester carboxylesterase
MSPTANSLPSTAAPCSVDRYLDVGGARLRYRDEGHGPAVILLHGWTLDLEMWDPQVATLASEFRLIRFDRRGFGLSTGQPGVEDDATDIANVCGQLGLPRVALIGMSQGARAALQFASRAPAQVSAMILDGPTALDRAVGDDDVPLAQLREILHTRGIAGLRRAWSSHALMRLRTPDLLMRRLLDRMIERYPGRDLAARAADAATLGSISLHSVRAPTLILSGMHDLVSRTEAAKRLCSQLPTAEHVTVPEAAHLINLDQPAVYSALCRAFLARHASVTAS